MNLAEYCTGIADAIREKEGSTDPIPAPDHAARIKALSTASGTISITTNGTHDVKKYASANVNVQSAPVLLWTNASPTSAFIPQKLSIDLREYEAVIIECKTTKSDEGYDYTYVCVGDDTGLASTTSYTTMPRTRCCRVSSTTISFSSGGWLSNTNNNDACIPTRIWGLKFTL